MGETTVPPRMYVVAMGTDRMAANVTMPMFTVQRVLSQTLCTSTSHAGCRRAIRGADWAPRQLRSEYRRIWSPVVTPKSAVPSPVMRSLACSRADTKVRWRALLQNLGDMLDDLADDYLMRVDSGARFYDNVPSEEDLRDAARLAFRYLLDTLLERPMSRRLIEFPAAVGSLRATQGIALENLTAAVRTDFLVAWSALLRLAGEDDMAILALHVDVLWKTVDDFTIQVQRGYLDQRLAMARTSALEQQHTLSDLFCREPAPTTVRRAAQILGLEETATYWIIGTPSEEAGRSVARRLLNKLLTPFEYIDRGIALILVAADGRWADDEAVVADVMSGLDGAVAPRSVPLADVHRAAATVRMLVDLGKSGATTLLRSWVHLSMAQLSEVIDDLRGYVLDPLRKVHDRELIVETIQTFADNGSVADTASVLYCHRNTVMNRIRRFEEATGISLRSPRSLAMVQLCLLPA